MRVKLRGQETDFLIHVENQATAQGSFPERMFRYFAHLTLHHSLPVYPIVLFSFDRPKRAEPSRYEVTFLDGPVLRFDYRVVQLNRLSWRDFLRHDNPVATALMAKMKIAREDRPQAKVELLRILASHKYDPARSELIGVFIERYLQLSAAEERQFRRIMAQLPQKEQETAMELMTSWGRAGLERGLHEGKEDLVLLQIRKRFGALPDDTVAEVARLSPEQLNQLGLALLTSRASLTWNNGSRNTHDKRSDSTT